MTPAQIGVISTSVISTIGNNVLGALSGIQLNALKPLQIAQLSTDQLSGLGSVKVGTLSAAWLNKLTEPQIQSFAASSFTLTQLKGLDTVHVKALSGTQVAALNTAQLGVLAAKQIAAIDANDVGMMTANQFTVLRQTQLKALTTGQVDKLDSAKVLTITAKNIASLSYQQIQHFSDDVVTNLSGQQLGALTKQQIDTGLDGRKIGLLSADQVKSFSRIQVQALTHPQVAALSVEDLAALSNTQLTAFKLDQISNFTNTQIAWVHDNKLNAGFAKGLLNKINVLFAAIPPPPLYTPGQAVIDLGQGNGKLISPVMTENGNWYYFWNRTGDGSPYDGYGSPQLEEQTSHEVLDSMFTEDVNGVVGGGGNTSDTFRYATIGGVRLALPTADSGPWTFSLTQGKFVDWNANAWEQGLTHGGQNGTWTSTTDPNRYGGDKTDAYGGYMGYHFVKDRDYGYYGGINYVDYWTHWAVFQVLPPP